MHMKTKKIISILAGIALALPIFASAQGVSTNFWRLQGSILRPIVSTWSLRIPQLGGGGIKCLQVDNDGDLSVASDVCSSASGSSAFSTSTAYASIKVIYPVNSSDVFVVGWDGTGNATSTGEAKFWIDPNNSTAKFDTGVKVGLSTTTPYLTLSVVGESELGNYARSGYVVATTTTATSTFAGSIQVGATAGDNAIKIAAARNYPTSESVGGALNINMGTQTGPAIVVYHNGTTGRAVSVVCDSASYDTQCLHVRNDGTETALNILGSPTGKGIVKIGSNGVGDADASGLSIDTSLSSFIGQGIFLKGNASGKLLNIRTSADLEILTMAATGYTGLASTTPFGRLSVNPIAGDSVGFVVGSSTGTHLLVDSSGRTLLGGATTATAEFQFDPANVTATFGTGGAGDSVLQFGPTDDIWSAGFDATDKSFTIASSTALGTNNKLTLSKSGVLTVTYASTTAVSGTSLCIGSDCRTAWPTAGGGLSQAAVASTTSTVSGQNIVYTVEDDDIITSGANSTTTAEYYYDPNIGRQHVTGTSTVTKSIQIGSAAQRDVAFGYVADRNSTTGESNAGAWNLNMGTFTGTGASLYSNAGAGAGRLLSVVCDNTAMDTQCFHVRGDQTAESVVNILGAPEGKGIVKIGANGVGDANASALSIDSSLASFLGQGIFLKCGSGSTCVNIRNENNVQGFTIQQTSLFVGIGTTTPQYHLTIASSTAPQLALSAGAGVSQWVMRNAGGKLYIATTTTAGTATSSTAALTIDNNGKVLANCFSTDGGATCVGAGAGSGTVTSVDFSVPTGFTISNNPITTSGTLALGLSMPSNSLLGVNAAGTGLVATGTSAMGPLTVGGINATGTATSTFVGPIRMTNAINSQNMLAVIPSGTLGSTAAPVQHGAVVIDNTLNTATPGLYVSSSQNGVPSNPLSIFRSDQSGYNQGLIWALGASTNTGGAAYGLKITDGNPDIEFDESDQTSPAGDYEIDVNNDLIRFNGRNTANTSFDTIAWFARNDKSGTGYGPRFCMGCGFTDLATSQFNIIATSSQAVPYFTISNAATAGATGNIFGIHATTSVMTNVGSGSLADNGVRVIIGGRSVYGNNQGAPLDHLTVQGRINTEGWNYASCDKSSNTGVASATSHVCGSLLYFEDTTDTTSPSLQSVGNTTAGYAYERLVMAVGAANSGNGLWMGGANGNAHWMLYGTTTPVMEVSARINPTTSTTTNYYIGFTNVNYNGSAYETGPTSGCYFTASSTTANWQAVCEAASTLTQVDTGVASSTSVTALGGWYRFRIEADSNNARFWMQTTDAGAMTVVADITTNLPTVGTTPGVFVSYGTGGAANNFDLMRFRVWWRDFLPSD